MAPAELRQRLAGGADLFLLDLRTHEEYAQWRLEGGEQLAVCNIPYVQFIEDEAGCIAQLPTDRTILVTCGKGGASAYVAERLAAHGLRALNLAGGLEAWGALYTATPATSATPGGLLLIQFHRVARGCLSYLAGCNGEALVVDPGHDTRIYLEAAAEHGLMIRAVVDTHLHADHISGGRALSLATGAPYYLPPADAGDVTGPFTPLQEGARLAIGDLDVLPLLTPGHTEGSTSLLVAGRYLLTGDTLFVAGAGRPDLGGQAAALVDRLYDTLFGRLSGFDAEIALYPAHAGAAADFGRDGICMTTLGEARRCNPALQMRDRSTFRREILSTLPPCPANYAAIREINMGRRTVSDAEAQELETGPNHCAAGRRRATS